MTATIVGLIGAVLGATAALFGAAWSDRRQARIEEARYRREQRAAAYEGALRYLNRAANRRSELIFGITGSRAYLGGDHVRDWFDDLVEAMHWLRVLESRCGDVQTPLIHQVVKALEEAAKDLDQGTSREVQWPAGRSDTIVRLNQYQQMEDKPGLLIHPYRWLAGLSDAINQHKKLEDKLVFLPHRYECEFIEPTNPAGLQPIMQAISLALEVVTDCARRDTDGIAGDGAHGRAKLLPGKN